MFSIGGIASGLDTENIITQLLSLEKQPIRRIEATQDQLRSVDQAWGEVATKLSSLRSATDALAQPGRFDQLVAVTSSNPDAVTVSRSGTADTGQLSFRVDQLAQAHQVATGTVADPHDALAAGTFTVTVGDTTTSVELDGQTSLRQLADQLNAADGGFFASIVKVADGEHRLVLEGDDTGADQALTVDDGGALGGTVTTLQAAQDAVLRMGTGDDAILLQRSSNTIGDLVPGATITLQRVTDDPVTVTARRDVDGAVKAVKDQVDALNGAISLLDRLSSYDATSNTAGKLQGDATARRLLADLRSAVTGFVGVGDHRGAFEVGLSVDRDGKVTLDESRLRDALAADFDAVGRFLTGSRSADDPLATSVAGTSRTTPGDHQVEITREARIASITGAVYTPPTEAQPKTFRVTHGSRSATVTLNTEHTTAELAAQAIRQALAEEGITGIEVGTDGDQLQLSTTRYGSAATFTVEALDDQGEVDPAGDAFGLAGTHTGQDVAGTIGGVEATGRGQVLTGADGTDAHGLSVTWTGDADDVAAASFTVRFDRGLAGELGQWLRSTEGSNGTISRARSGIESQIAVYQERIEGFERRLETRESTLRRQFTAMETALAQLHSQGDWLTSQISQLQNLNRSVKR